MKRIGEIAEEIVEGFRCKCTCEGNTEASADCPARARDLANLRGASPGEIAGYAPFCKLTQAQLTPDRRARFARQEAVKIMIEGGFPREMAARAAVEALPNEVQEWRPPLGLFLAGKPGVGKTWACAALVRRELAGSCSERWEYPAAFVYAPDIPAFSRVRDMAWLGARLLVLDDLPLYDAQRAGMWLSVIDFRYRNRLALLATANTDMVNLSALPQAWRPALSRLTDRTRSISMEIGGPDRRLE